MALAADWLRTPTPARPARSGSQAIKPSKSANHEASGRQRAGCEAVANRLSSRSRLVRARSNATSFEVTEFRRFSNDLATLAELAASEKCERVDSEGPADGRVSNQQPKGVLFTNLRAYDIQAKFDYLDTVMECEPGNIGLCKVLAFHWRDLVAKLEAKTAGEH